LPQAHWDELSHPLGCDVVGANCEPDDFVNAGSCCGDSGVFDGDDSDCVVNGVDTPVESVDDCDGDRGGVDCGGGADTPVEPVDGCDGCDGCGGVCDGGGAAFVDCDGDDVGDCNGGVV